MARHNNELPSDPLAAIQFQRRVRDYLVAADAPMAGEYAAMLSRYEAAGGAEPLDRAFGLVPACGQEGWATRERRSQRDAALVEAWRRFYPDISASGAAAVMARDIARIGQLAVLPRDGRSILLAEIHRLSGQRALRKRQIINVLARNQTECAMKDILSLHGFSLHTKAPKLSK